MGAMTRSGIGVVSIDMEGGDWFRRYKPNDVLNRIMKQLDTEQRGVILLHARRQQLVDLRNGLVSYR